MVDSIDPGDWDKISQRVSKSLKVNKNDDLKTLKDKLGKLLRSDKRSRHLARPENWRQVWSNILSRIVDRSGLKLRGVERQSMLSELFRTHKDVYVSAGGEEKSFNRDRQKTAKVVVDNFEEFKRRTPSKVDMDGVDTKDGERVRK